MALTVDTIESILKARTGDYIRDMNAATSAYEKWRNAQNGEQAVTDKVERASSRRSTAKRREVEMEVQAQARIAVAVDRGIAKREQEATAAERAADRIVRAGSKAATANQTRLMSTTSLGAVPGQGPVDTVNYALRDQIDLRNKLRIATIAGDQAAVDGIQDQLTYLANLRTFKQAGLDDTQAAIRAEQALVDVVQARTAAEARNVNAGVAGAGRAANATRNLGRQFQDIGVGLVGGQGVFLVLAQQIPQVADALTDMAPKAGIAGKAIKALQFFATPTGAILLAAASAAAIFGSRMFESSKSVDSLVASLQKEYKESQASDEAKKRFGDTLEGVTKAVIDQKNALDELAKSDKSAAEQANISANAALNKALAIREATAAAAAAARDEANGFALGITGSAGSTVAQIAGADQRRIAAEKRAAEAEAALVISRSNVDRTRANLASEQATREAARRSDPSEKIRIDSEERIKNLRIANTKAIIAANGNLKEQQRLSNGLADSIANVTKKRDEDLRKIQESNNASNRQIGRTVSVSEATSIVEGIGGRVTSGLRSNATQQRLYADKLAGRHAGPVAVPGTSDHERGQAIDVAYGPGINIASIRKAFADAGVRIRQILNEPEQRVFHVAFGKAGKSAEALANAAEAEKNKAEREAERRKDAQERYTQDLNSINSAILSAKGREAQGIEEAATVAVNKAIADDKDRQDDYAKRARESKLDYSLLQQKSRQLRAVEIGAAVAEEVVALAKQDQEIAAGARDRALELQTAELSLVTNRKDRLRIQGEILEAEYENRRLVLEANVAEAKRTKNKVAQAEAEGQLANLPRLLDIQREGVRRDNESPLDRYRREIGDVGANINDSLEQVEVRGLVSLNDKLTDTISNVFKLGGAFGEIANQIISDLIRIAVQQAIIKPLAGALFGGGSGGGGNSLVADPREDAKILKSLGGSILGGGGGIGGAIAGILGGLFSGKRAVGGTVSAGSLYRVNEQGTEGYASFSQPGRIIPLGEMNTRSQGNTTIVQQTIALDARYGITTPELINYVNQVGRTAATQGASYGAKIAVKAAPGAAATQRRFGG